MRKSKVLLIPFFWLLIVALFHLIPENNNAWAEIAMENPECPGAIWVGADTDNFSSVTDRNIAQIIIHATGSTYGSTKNSFQNPSHQASAHYVIDQDGKIYQFVLEKDIAGHAKPHNPYTIGIELVSGYSEPNKPSYLYNSNWATAEIYQSAAKLVKYLCEKYNIPKDRKYIIGHSEIIPNPKGKADPGPYWDWTRFMKLLGGGGDDKVSLFELISRYIAWIFDITTPHDPNELLVFPEGDIRPGDRLNYTINYENEGEGIAFGVYIADTLEEDLDISTLSINNNGVYDAETRTITWFIGELGSKQKGSVSFSVNAKIDLADGAEVINFATVYFPSVPEATRTNGTVNKVTTATDTTPPTTQATLLPQPNQSGWNNSDATVTLTAQDNEGGSGVSKTEYSLDNTNWITYASPFTITNEGTTTAYYRSTDNLNNTESTNSLEIKLDKTPPTITAQALPQANPSGWNNSDVTVTFTATDNLSGVSSVTQPQTITTEGANQLIGGQAIDLAGNSASTSVTINIDKTQPEVIITTPQEQAEYILKESVLSSWQTTDTLSGIASATGTAPSGSSLDTSTVGTKVFNVTALDNAGNKTEKTNTYYVRYNYSGILPPINPDGSSIFKLGRTIPVKFQLKDSSGNFISTAIAKLYLAKISNDILGTEVEAESVGEANTGNLFRYDTTNNQYIFNLGTTTLSEGTWQIRISLDDGTSKYVNFGLK